MKYIMVWPYGWFDSYMYKDIIDSNMVETFCLNTPRECKILDFFRRVHHSYKINNIVDLPYKEFWYKGLYEMIDASTCIVFSNGALSMLTLDFLKKVKNINKSLKMVAIVMDSIHGASKNIIKALPKLLDFEWDAILSYDINDCEEYGFQFLGQGLYSKLPSVHASPYQSDLYYMGNDKAGKKKMSRNREVLSYYNKFQEDGVVVNFNLVGSFGGGGEVKPGITFSNKSIPYEDVVSDILSTNCILEIVGKGQFVQTARYYEAVCYNKKLLTNNFAVKKLPFYDERYIRCFDDIEDIDMEWVKKKEPIDYHYNGEFSPIHIIEKLEKMFS